MKDVISMRDFSREDIMSLINEALKIKKDRHGQNAYPATRGKIASLFFENSTRTRVSSETAAYHQGLMCNGFSGVEGTSVKKGEPLMDTARMFAGYGYGAIIMRHPLAGAARLVGDHLDIPVINAGDGSSGHPTQTLLDLMTIYETFGKLDGLQIAMVGDLKYGRTVHSLLQALELFESKIHLLSPDNLQCPPWRLDDYRKQSGKDVHVCDATSDAFLSLLRKTDVVYMTRIQRERFPEGTEGEAEFLKVAGLFCLQKNMLGQARPDLIILHPLPRDKFNLEIAMDVDETKHARYFEQAKNGLYMRQAIIARITEGSLSGRAKHGENHPAGFVELPIIHGEKKGENLLYRLDSGTLIDHIECGKGPMVYRMLGLHSIVDSEVVLSMNIKSQRWGRKDVLAIHGRELTPEQLYKVALIGQHHTINVIQCKKVIKKGRMLLPSQLRNFVICPNPLCVSRREHKEYAPGIFNVELHSPLQVRCHYCEQLLDRQEIELYE